MLKVYHDILHFGDVEDLSWSLHDLMPEIGVDGVEVVHGFGLNCAKYMMEEQSRQYPMDTLKTGTRAPNKSL